MPLKKLSKTKLSVLIFSFSILCLTLAFFLSGLTWKQIVAAFSTKSPGSNLTSTDWNGLLGDFVKKSGDTMAGSLTAPKIVTSQMCLGGVCKSNWPAGSGQCIVANRGYLNGIGPAGKPINKPSCPSAYPYPKLGASLRSFHGVGNVNYDDWVGVNFKDLGSYWQVQAGDCDACRLYNGWYHAGGHWGIGAVNYVLYCCK